MAKLSSEKLTTYYMVLKVSPGATHQEIVDSWRYLAIKHHPDKGGDVEEFKKITEAWSVLKDTKLRTDYDRRLNMTLRACSRCDGQGIVFSFNAKNALQTVKKCADCRGVGFFTKEKS